jgi:hypothetical protein
MDGFCTIGFTTFQGLIDMWTSTLCPVGDATFHDPRNAWWEIVNNVELTNYSLSHKIGQEELEFNVVEVLWKGYSWKNKGKTWQHGFMAII